MTIRIPGNWKKGFAYDIHTLDSVYLGVDDYGHDRWENTRSEMGELLYDLKYHGRAENVGKIVDMLNRYKGIEEMDAIVPVPSTNKNRRIQPVLEIAKELGRRVAVPVLENLLFKRSGGPELKNVNDPQERKQLLKNSLYLSDGYDVSGKNVLLIDDLYRSGATLSVATEMLYEKAGVEDVFVLTMTKTRSNR
jgi:predicted amidophosphoribosyltransferase